MSTQEIKPGTTGEGSAQPKRSRSTARLIVVVLVILVTVVAVGVGVSWGSYRYNYLVLSEASIKGTVTRMGARIEGRVKSIEVEAGQLVAKGQVLLRMEDRHMQAALDRARAELQSATRELSSEKLGVEQARRRLTLELSRVDAGRRKAEGELEATKSYLVKSEKQYERFADLMNKGAVAASEMDRVTGERDRARGTVNADIAVLEGAESNYQKAMNELEGVHVREAKLEVVESQIEVARARVSVAEADLEATVIKAPEDGRVLDRIVEVGGSAKVGEPIISLWIGHPWVEAWADERDLPKIKIGSEVDISLDASPSRKLSGRVAAIGFETDRQLQLTSVPSTLRTFVHQNAMVPVRIALEAGHSGIQLGLSVLVGIKKESEVPEVERPHVAQSTRH